MFGLLRREQAVPRLEGNRIFLRPPLSGDFAQWRDLRERSRSFLVPWEPGWNADELHRRSWRLRIKSWRNDMRSGATWPFFVFERSSGALAGGISVFNVRHGAAESAEIGYWSGEPFAGRGYMGEALGLVVPFCFDVLGLRRIVAACIPDNTRSARLLEKAGFEREGVVRSYLRINGVRRDHVLYSLVAPYGGMP